MSACQIDNEDRGLTNVLGVLSPAIETNIGYFLAVEIQDYAARNGIGTEAARNEIQNKDWFKGASKVLGPVGVTIEALALTVDVANSGGNPTLWTFENVFALTWRRAIRRGRRGGCLG
jgi:hypothetical protein